MSLDALILYGSWARRDNNAGSDVDVLGLTPTAEHSMVVRRKVNISIYPMKVAERMASSGDLFMLHVTSEGLALHDPRDLLGLLRERFRYRDSYDSEVQRAFELGWALLAVSDEVGNLPLLHKRVAWCVRTILIAKTAELRKPMFAAEALAKFSSDRNVARIIRGKDLLKKDRSILTAFEQFLQANVGGRPQAQVPLDSVESFREYFGRCGNVFAEQTMQRLLVAGGSGSYSE